MLQGSESRSPPAHTGRQDTLSLLPVGSLSDLNMLCIKLCSSVFWSQVRHVFLSAVCVQIPTVPGAFLSPPAALWNSALPHLQSQGNRHSAPSQLHPWAPTGQWDRPAGFSHTDASGWSLGHSCSRRDRACSPLCSSPQSMCWPGTGCTGLWLTCRNQGCTHMLQGRMLPSGGLLCSLHPLLGSSGRLQACHQGRMCPATGDDVVGICQH